jgi:hypothetical protein
MLTGILGVQDSAGNVIEATDAQGNTGPTFLRLGSGISSSAVVEGYSNIVTLASTTNIASDVSPGPLANEIVWGFDEDAQPYYSEGAAVLALMGPQALDAHGKYGKGLRCWETTGLSGVRSVATTVGQSNSITVSFWLKLTTLGNATIVSKSYASGNTWTAPYGFSIDMTSAGAITASIVVGGVRKTTAGEGGFGTLHTNGWQHVAVTYDHVTGILRSFIDGHLVQTYLGTINTPLDWGSGGPWVVGAAATNTAVFSTGMVDDLRILPEARRATDIRALMARTQPVTATVVNPYPLAASTVLYWDTHERSEPFANQGNGGTCYLGNLSQQATASHVGVFEAARGEGTGISSGFYSCNSANTSGVGTTIGNTTSCTYSIWGLGNAVVPVAGSCVFGKTKSGTTYTYAVRIGIGTSGSYSFVVTTASGTITADSPAVYTPPALVGTKWTHMALTYDGTTGTVVGYMNGVEIARATGTPGSPLYDGASGGSVAINSYGPGAYSNSPRLLAWCEPRVDNVALPAATILAMYQNGAKCI